MCARQHNEVACYRPREMGVWRTTPVFLSVRYLQTITFVSRSLFLYVCLFFFAECEQSTVTTLHIIHHQVMKRLLDIQALLHQSRVDLKDTAESAQMASGWVELDQAPPADTPQPSAPPEDGSAGLRERKSTKKEK